MSDAPFINISAYKFVPLNDLPSLRADLLQIARDADLKGTILLASEGINLFLAGTRVEIDDFLAQLRSLEPFADFPVKESPSDHQPFSRLLVRIKKEIIAFGVEGIDPANRTSPKLSAVELKRWLDEGREVELLDVRNDYEVDLGTFEAARPIGVNTFRDFPDAVDRLPSELKQKPVVMFCTGGIRCEKAGPLMEQRGFEQIYQLDGGILKYFEEVGGEHYDGECFVFDKRVAVDGTLEETDTTQCYACQHPLTADDQRSAQYDPPHHCPHCYQTPDEKARQLAAEQTKKIAAVVSPLPGSQPYDLNRPLNVPGRFDRFRLIDFLCDLHPHVGQDRWQEKIDSGKIVYKGSKVPADAVVRSGMRLEHLLPGTIEPDVNPNIEILWEDDSIVAVNKPAPLPMHPCGRYNLNTLCSLLDRVYHPLRLRIVHRLDANTSGIVLLAKKRRVASVMLDQFQAGHVHKTYLARVVGQMAEGSGSRQDFRNNSSNESPSKLLASSTTKRGEYVALPSGRVEPQRGEGASSLPVRSFLAPDPPGGRVAAQHATLPGCADPPGGRVAEPGDRFECNVPIGRVAGVAGARSIDESGQQARTEFEILSGNESSTDLIARPITGRTNQIRLHLWHLGHPVIGDPMFLPDRQLGQQQTLSPADAPLQLHAFAIQFRHPETREVMSLQSPPPKWFTASA